MIGCMMLDRAALPKTMIAGVTRVSAEVFNGNGGHVMITLLYSGHGTNDNMMFVRANVIL
jgi:hypothetical protein